MVLSERVEVREHTLYGFKCKGIFAKSVIKVGWSGGGVHPLSHPTHGRPAPPTRASRVADFWGVKGLWPRTEVIGDGLLT
jgi:hypothetical protein